MECGIGSFKTLRNVCKFVCFGGIFVWILVVSVRRGYQTNEGETMQLKQGNPDERFLHGSRRLLETAATVDNQTYDIDKNAECTALHSLPKHNQHLLCEFVSKVTACGGDGGFIPYFKIVYCWMPLNLLPLSMTLLFIWLLYLFVFLGTTAEEYFCPALTVISQLLRLSQNIAGVTLLAFGNGAPDIFSALAAINQPDIKRASLAFGALFGAGMFVSCVVVGAVIFSKPFTLTRRPYMRDLIFYMAACYWTFFLLWDNYIDIWMSIGFIAMYLLYVCVVIFGRIIYQKWKNKPNTRTAGDIPRPIEREKGEEMSSSTVKSTLLPANGIHSNGIPKQRVTISDRDYDDDNLSHSGEIMAGSMTGIDSTMEHDSHQEPPHGGPSIRVEVHSVHSDDGSRCSTPQQRCASRASQAVYGVSGEDSLPEHQQQQQQQRNTLAVTEPDPNRLTVSAQVHKDSRHMSHEPVRKATTPSPRRLRKTISGALNITEDVGLTAIGTPNLSKIWHHAYRRELIHENTSRSNSPFVRGSPMTARSRSPLGPLASRNRSFSDTKGASEDEYSSGLENEADNLLAEPEDIWNRRKKMHPFVRLMLVFWPFGEAFKALRIWGKIYELVKYPAGCLLSITVPVIDRDEEMDNWNRWLNIVQCVLAPLFICFTTNIGLILIGEVLPVSAIVLVGGVCLAVLIACTSQNDKQPKYHCIFAWLGFGVAVVWIYSIANEIVNVLQVFGVVVGISDGILGITLLAWGNSIGDAVANVTMARQGFPRMAMGACYGGPLLNMLLGIGLAATVKSVQQKNLGFSLYFTQVQMFAALFLLFSLTASLIISSCLKFKMRRMYGVVLFIVYVTFLLTVILAEIKVFDIKIENVLSPF